MRVIDSLTSTAGRLAGDLQGSLRRARVEGERRLLQRQHRAALEELGLRVYELVKAGDLSEEPIAAEIAAVEGKLIEIEAKVAEIERERAAEEGAADDSAGDADDGSARDDDPALTAFPMIADDRDRGEEASSSPS
jgi:hypothetical protein